MMHRLMEAAEQRIIELKTMVDDLRSQRDKWEAQAQAWRADAETWREQIIHLIEDGENAAPRSLS